MAAHGATAIAQGSKSFALASRLFHREMRADAQMLYAWCRRCDDVIDGQSMGEDAPDADLSADEQAARLQRLRRDTARALAGEPVGDPAFDGFAAVAAKVALPERYPFDLLDGFEMDVARRRYETIDDLLAYCYGVAGVVGVMMAIVMGVAPNDEETLDRACDLGLAFQLTNVCRDMVDDARAGRIYPPAELLRDEGLEEADPESLVDPAARGALARVAGRLLDVADCYYESGGAGLRRLPARGAAAVGAARSVYRDIGRIVRDRGASAWDARAYATKSRKAWLALSGAARAAPQPIFLARVAPDPRPGLWRRPRAGADG
ncbi:MAG: phytoene/squalene synthase family protein [Parvularculaceae bacterium]